VLHSERPALGTDDFVRMLLLDGSFILQFFFKWDDKVPDALCYVGWGLTLAALQERGGGDLRATAGELSSQIRRRAIFLLKYAEELRIIVLRRRRRIVYNIH
jgi:hypothetical protein